MGSENWLGKLWTRLRSGVVADVPPGLEACECCRETNCTQQRWEICEHRLATESATLAANGPNALRTGELLPRVPLDIVAPKPDAERAMAPASDEPPRARKISNH